MQSIRLAAQPPLMPPLPPPPPTQSAAPSSSSPFLDLLVGKVQEVNSMQQNADAMVHQMLTGGEVNQAEMLTAVQKADLAFRMMMQIRNKLIDAYREVQQIQI